MSVALVTPAHQNAPSPGSGRASRASRTYWATRPQGPPGTGNMRIVHQSITPVVLSSTGAHVLSLMVPAGTYAINAKVAVANVDAAAQSARRTLSTGDLTLVEIEGGSDAGEMISLLDAATLASDTAIALTCSPRMEAPWAAF